MYQLRLFPFQAKLIPLMLFQKLSSKMKRMSLTQTQKETLWIWLIFKEQN